MANEQTTRSRKAVPVGTRIKVAEGVWSDDGETCLAGETGVIDQYVPSLKHGWLYFVTTDKAAEDGTESISLYPEDFEVLS